MRKRIKGTAMMAAAMTATMMFTVPALAASDDTRIKEVEFRVSVTDEPKAGEDIGSTPDITIVKGGNKCEIQSGSIEWDDDDGEWVRGEKPVLYLTLEAKDGYYFSSTDLSTTKSAYKASKRSGSDKYELNVKITLDAVGGDLDVVEDVWWDGRTAHWEEIDDADKYEVKLYRNNSTVATITTSGKSYNCYPYMTKAGDYTFKVRGLSNSDGEKGEWSDESDEYYMNSSDVYNGAVPNSNGNGGWNEDAYGWTYTENGVRLANQWRFIDNNWFWFHTNGYMATGWIYTDNNWFYLNPVSDGTKGAMKTDWQFINGYWYYLNPVSDGTRGARKSSYQLINNQWYFLDPASGALWTNCVVPNGMVADAQGVLH